jgi:hypothetical protein
MEPQRKIFNNPQLQKEFDRNGFVVINLFSNNEIKDFVKLYDMLEGAKGTANTNKNTYELSFFEKDVASKKNKFNAIYDFIKPFIDKHLDNYSPIIINLFNKEHGTGEVPVHQNWTFVDEKKYTSVSVWCPLQPVSHENGTLEVVPGSHKVISDYRGPSIPWVFDELNEIMKTKYMVPLNLQPGEVAVIDDSVIHYSAINNTPIQRKAIQLILKPAEVSTIHCFKDSPEDATVNIIEVEDDYFFDFNMWEKPNGGKNKQVINFPVYKISEAELIDKCNINLQMI